MTSKPPKNVSEFVDAVEEATGVSVAATMDDGEQLIIFTGLRVKEDRTLEDLFNRPKPLHERLAATGENWAEHLDELVHDTKGSEAADINNSGTAGQIEYLLDSGVAVFHILNCLGREDLMGEEPDEHKEGCTYPTVCPKCGCMITDKGFCSDLTCPNSDSGA